MKRINSELRTTALFKCVATTLNNTHKILRGLSVHLVAQITAGFRSNQKSPFVEKYCIDVNGETIVLSDFNSLKFINERTGEELITLA